MLLCWAVVCLPAGAVEQRAGDAGGWLGRDDSSSIRSSSIWPDGMGNGLRTSVNEVAFAAGPAIGTRKFAGWRVHHLVLGRIDYARLRTGVIGHGPLRGSIEGRIELWGGGQYHPEGAYLLGFTPTLRYNFATGTRWMPFADMGAGVSLTDIGLPDLGTTFEFNLQAGGGCSYFLKDDLALTLQYRFIHVSNGHADTPNVGVNTNAIYIGLSRYF